MSHYENGKHKPKFELVCRFAEVLSIPEGYFYTLYDSFADAMLKLYGEYGYSGKGAYKLIGRVSTPFDVMLSIFMKSKDKRT